MTILEDIKTAVQKGKRKQVGPLVEEAIEAGVDPQEILDKGMIAAMDEIGEKFSAGTIFVPEMLIAARAMTVGTETLKPYLSEEGSAPAGKAVIGTVKGDMHDIGKNLVRMMVEGKGIEIEDLGVDVDPQAFVDYLKANPDCHLVLCSALLTTTMPNIDETIKAIEDAGLRDQVMIMIGGAPVTEEYAAKVGADRYTDDAGSAAAAAAELLSA